MKNFLFFILGALVASVIWYFADCHDIDGLLSGSEKHPSIEQIVSAQEELIKEGEDLQTRCDEMQEQLAQEDEKNAQKQEVGQVAQTSVVGRWSLSNPVGYSEQERMLSFDEYGTFKDYYNTSSGLSHDFTYILQDDMLKYKDEYSRTYVKSFRFKVSTVNGKDYLEVFDNADFGGKWVRSM